MRLARPQKSSCSLLSRDQSCRHNPTYQSNTAENKLRSLTLQCAGSLGGKVIRATHFTILWRNEKRNHRSPLKDEGAFQHKEFFTLCPGENSWQIDTMNAKPKFQTNGNRRIARKLAMVGTLLGLWGALVLLFAAPLALTGPVSWRQAVSFGGSFWALWLLFLPAVAWLSFRFPIERRRLLRNVGLHLLACLLVVGTSRASFRAVARIFPRPQRSEAPGRSPASKTDRPEPPGAFGLFLALRAA